MPKAGLSHDISFLRQDGSTEIGLMLVTDKNGVPAYREYDDPTLSQQFFSGEPGYANLPPEKAIQIGQTDWRAGVGQEIYDPKDSMRYWKAFNCDGRFRGQFTAGPNAGTITKPTGVVRCHAEFNGNSYIGVDNFLRKLDSNYDEYATLHTLPQNITALCVYGSTLFIGQGTTNKYYYMATDEGTPTISGQDDGMADFFEVVDGTLWKAVLPNELKSSTDPEGEGWTTATMVGATFDDIIQLMTESGQLFVRKEDMPYYLDTDGNVHRLIPELATAPATAGTKGDVWQGKLYIPCGDQGLIEYDDGVTTWRSPAKFCDNSIEFSGKVFAVCHDEEWVFIITDNSPQVEILAGREGIGEIGADWVWHPIGELTLTGCQFAWVSTVGKKRLYIASTVNSETLYYIPLPTTYGDLSQDSNYAFETGGYFITPWHYANFRGDYKSFIKLTLELQNVDEDNYITASYRLWGQDDFTPIGDYQTEGVETKYIPAADSTNPSGTMIQFMFEFTVA